MGRTASMVFGLALVMALLFGAVSVGLAANGNPFILGKAANAATKATGLVGRMAAGEALVVKNPSGGSALGLSVGDPQAAPATKTVAPMKVDSQAVVGNLNADKIDGKDSTDFVQSDAAAGGDLGGNYANLQIAGNAVGAGEVANGSLDVADVTEFQFNFTVDLPPINGQSCYTGSETLSTVDGGDLVIVNAADDLPSGLVMFPLTPSSSNPQFKYRVCNITSSTIDLAAGNAWRLAVFDDGNDN